jgi:GTP-binding protein EngB required for normal cell division
MSATEIMDKLSANFELLRNIVRTSSSIQIKADLSKVDYLINRKIEDVVKDNAPPDFHILYADFKAEYEKFKDFILYDKLIGKNIVALGGGFSSGKSSFLNAIMGKAVLPSDIDPSTSVPTFIVEGSKHYLSGINVFDAKFEIDDVLMVRKIGHGFGKIENEFLESASDIVTLGHIIESLFFSTPLLKYKNLAFLDTPGYSKPDTSSYSAKTDEHIARRQLNTANCILWFIQADAGTITEDDIKFIKTLNESTPKLFILNKADKKTDDDVKDIIAKIKATLEMKGLKYVDVLAYSTKSAESYDAENIKKWFEKWNVPNEKNNFAVNFKKLFIKCLEYYEEEIETETKRLKRLNRALTLSEDSEISESINFVIKSGKSYLSVLDTIKANLSNMQTEFFVEIKMVGDIVGIDMPEPTELSMIGDNANNPLDVLNTYMKKKGLKANNNYQELMTNAFEDVIPVMNKNAGGSEYKDSLMDVLKNLDTIKTPLKFGEDSGRNEYLIENQNELLEFINIVNSIAQTEGSGIQ